MQPVSGKHWVWPRLKQMQDGSATSPCHTRRWWGRLIQEWTWTPDTSTTLNSPSGCGLSSELASLQSCTWWLKLSRLLPHLPLACSYQTMNQYKLRARTSRNSYSFYDGDRGTDGSLESPGHRKVGSVCPHPSICAIVNSPYATGVAVCLNCSGAQCGMVQPEPPALAAGASACIRRHLFNFSSPISASTVAIILLLRGHL